MPVTVETYPNKKEVKKVWYKNRLLGELDQNNLEESLKQIVSSAHKVGFDAGWDKLAEQIHRKLGL